MNIIYLIKEADSLSPAIKELLDQHKQSNSTKIGSSYLSQDVLRSKLSDLQYRVTQNKETEKPFTGAYVTETTPGIYKCIVCEAKLFNSEAKFASSCGWPAFKNPIENKSLAAAIEVFSGRLRVEISCGQCNAHLGHVFDDGPKPTGLRYCINSCAMILDANTNFSQDSSSPTK